MFLFLTEVAATAWMDEPEGWLAVIVVTVGMASLPACLAFFIIPGLKTYLQLPRPRFVAITAAFVGFLFSFTVFAFVALWMEGGF